MNDYLVVCTGNICRSPMAEAMLRQECSQRGVPDGIASAGVAAVPGQAATQEAVRAVRAWGLDLSGHRSQPSTSDLVGGSALVLTMEVAHVVRLVSSHPERFPTTFTLRELVERVQTVTGPRSDRSLEEWVAALNEGRSASGLLARVDLDVVDPYGHSEAAYRRCAEELHDLSSRAAAALWGKAPVPLSARQGG